MKESANDLKGKFTGLIEQLGSDDYVAMAEKFGITDSWPEEYKAVFPAAVHYDRKPWTDLITDENSHLVSEEAFDLLDKMLRYDYTERITAKDAMEHAYFKGLNDTASEYEYWSSDFNKKRIERLSRQKSAGDPSGSDCYWASEADLAWNLEIK